MEKDMIDRSHLPLDRNVVWSLFTRFEVQIATELILLNEDPFTIQVEHSFYGSNDASMVLCDSYRHTRSIEKGRPPFQVWETSQLGLYYVTVYCKGSIFGGCKSKRPSILNVVISNDNRSYRSFDIHFIVRRTNKRADESKTRYTNSSKSGDTLKLFFDPNGKCLLYNDSRSQNKRGPGKDNHLTTESKIQSSSPQVHCRGKLDSTPKRKAISLRRIRKKTEVAATEEEEVPVMNNDDNDEWDNLSKDILITNFDSLPFFSI